MSFSSLGHLELFRQRKIVGRGQGSDLIFFWTLESWNAGKLKSGKTQKLLIINFFKKLVYSLKEGFNTDISFKKFLAQFSRKSVTKNSSHWNSFSLAIS